MRQWIALLAVMALAPPAGATAQSQHPETLSLLGKPLIPPAIPADRRKTLEADLAAARAAYDKDPADADAIIWLGRRTAYLGRFGEAVEIYTRGIEVHPEDARLYRHRGHRYITLRKFDLAIRDLEKAAELVADKPDQVEPDGQPNARNIPTSTLNSNIYYHLGLAHYLKAEFARARDAYRKCLEFSKNPDMLVATTSWLYMTLQRMHMKDEAQRVLDPIAPDMDVIENQAYHRLLLAYKGTASQESLKGAKGIDAVTIGYALGNMHVWAGATDQGVKALKLLLEKNAEQWPAFGYIAAEADVARLDKPKKRR